MDLYLSTNSPWNTTWCNKEGQVIYKSESPMCFTLGPRLITIKRILPSNVDKEHAMRDSFSHLAEIDYSYFLTSRIRYNGIDMDTTEFFRKSGWSLFGRNRVFKGPDGKEYEWQAGRRVCKVRDARPASLEISPQGQHMVDLIVVTFIFVEKLRTDRERHSRSHGGGGP
ncbi:hypothetical protein BYT27DRAFT_7197424 [Phlegmacium glaucopus]|nr:hypothetical protein BYT27DRAFT_7197424 [Phlegmacium glaucopus]